ncbi:related to sister chromatid cohesion protein Ctf8 [Cephalotrichum gorgonifer]|uniref:Related to sister chromatid cohesion protein Ctf8 n=1 Tax=Cephalotrichum gorgonifer TaxID=2041049 RepID=A0AAE8SWT5_9PEZI|nr:related to sister chromatid cohesion protein Ctf8 [Cephalotrichum gorgonifer]
MDPTIPISPPNPDRGCSVNPLPKLIQTPSGLAFIGLQGTFKLPQTEGGEPEQVSIGTIHFPNYKPEDHDKGDTAWMKRVYMYVGRGMRLTGQVKKLPKAVAVVRRLPQTGDSGEAGEALEVLEIIKYRLEFSERPEPVGANE